MKKYIVLFLLLSVMGSVHSQNHLVDSVMAAAVTDSAKIDALNKIFLAQEFIDQDVAASCLEKALVLCSKYPGSGSAAFTSYHAGFLAEDKGNYPEALTHYYDAMRIFEKLGRRMEQASALFCIGNVYYLQEDYQEALKRFTAALQVYQMLGDQPGIANAHNNLGGVYFHQKNYTMALQQYSQGLRLRKKLGDDNAVADSYINIGNVYSEMKNYDTALVKYFAGLGIMEKLGRKAKASGILSNIGMVYMIQKKNKAARTYLDSSRVLAEEFGMKETLRNTYKALSELDSATGDFKNAFLNHRLYVLYRDSLDNEEIRNRTIREQMDYEFDKKQAVANAEHQKELEVQQVLADEKTRKQNIIIAFVIAGLLLVILFAVFVSRSLKTARKQRDIIQEQKNHVEEQKLEVELQKELLLQKQKEIIDSINYARRIQRSQMPTEKHIHSILNRVRIKGK